MEDPWWKLVLPPLTLSAVGLQTLKGRFIFWGPNLSGFFRFFSVSKVQELRDLLSAMWWVIWVMKTSSMLRLFSIRIVEKHRTSAYKIYKQKPSQHPSCLPFIISTSLNFHHYHPTHSLRPDVLHQVGNRGVIKHQGGRQVDALHRALQILESRGKTWGSNYRTPKKWYLEVKHGWKKYGKI